MILKGEGFKPEKITTTGEVSIIEEDDGFLINKIHLTTKVRVDGIEDSKFKDIAEKGKGNCPVSKALSNVPSIRFDAELIK